MATKKTTNSRVKMLLLFAVLSIVSFVAILWALVKVQWVEGDVWREKSEKRSKLRQVDPARRGNIYSSDGKILATTVPVCDLYLDFSITPRRDNQGRVKKNDAGDTLWWTPISDSAFLKRVDTAAMILHQAFPETPAEEFKAKLETLRERHGGCMLVRRAMPYTEWLQICRLRGWSRGVVTLVDGRSVIHNLRFHTYGSLAESVIGFRYTYELDKYSGLEGYYDSILRGQDGQVLCRRLTRGIWLPVDQGSLIHDSERNQVETEEDPDHPRIDGADIVSTIDTRFQDIAHYSLEKTLSRLGSTAGCAILMEVATGNVLVCSSLVLDTATGTYAESPNRNVALADLYEPGSVFKPVLLTAMYNDPKVMLDTAMLLPVGARVFSQNSKEVKDHGLANGQYPLWKAVAVSSNVAFCELAWRNYRDRRDTLLSEVKSIFPYERLNVDLRGPESQGQTHTLRYDNDFLRFCYGYASSVSPLRMATFYNALANGGRMVKPRFCKAIIANGEVEELPVQVIHEHICTEETALTIRSMLVGVVEGGTGDNIKNENYSIAGKTGTAETSPGATTSNATFVGFFPAEKPKYTCLVLLRDVRSFGRNAAPVFQDIADCVVSIDKELDCRPTIKQKGSSDLYRLPTVAKAPQAEVRHAHKQLGLDYTNVTAKSLWCTFRAPVDSLGIRAGYETYFPPKGQTPNCIGMTLKDALLLCRSVGLDVTFEGVGKVVSQNPKSHTPTQAGETVHLTLKN